MVLIDTGIEHRPHDSRAGGTESTDGRVGLDGADRAVQMSAQHQIRPHPIDEAEAPVVVVVSAAHQPGDLVRSQHAPHVVTRHRHRLRRARGAENVSEQPTEAAPDGIRTRSAVQAKFNQHHTPVLGADEHHSLGAGWSSLGVAHDKWANDRRTPTTGGRWDAGHASQPGRVRCVGTEQVCAR